MPRYIDAENLIKKIFPVGLVDGGKYTINAKAVKCAIDSIPTADVVEVVRCKDCTEWDETEGECSHWYGFRENDFCSYGERKVE